MPRLIEAFTISVLPHAEAFGLRADYPLPVDRTNEVAYLSRSVDTNGHHPPVDQHSMVSKVRMSMRVVASEGHARSRHGNLRSGSPGLGYRRR